MASTLWILRWSSMLRLRSRKKAAAGMDAICKVERQGRQALLLHPQAGFQRCLVGNLHLGLGE